MHTGSKSREIQYPTSAITPLPPVASPVTSSVRTITYRLLESRSRSRSQSIDKTGRKPPGVSGEGCRCPPLKYRGLDGPLKCM